MTLLVGHRTYFDGEPTVHSYEAAGEVPCDIRIGRYCSIASGVQFLPGGTHRLNAVSTWPWQHAGEGRGQPPTLRGPILIGNDVWIGYGARILGGVSIGDGAIVGAWAVDSRDVAPYMLAAGNPARVYPRSGELEEFKDQLLRIAWWDWDDQDERLLDVENLSISAFCKKHKGVGG